MTGRVLVTGATGYVGQFIVERLLADGFDVVAGGRTPFAQRFSRPLHFLEMSLEKPPEKDVLVGMDAIVHAAFDHLPGKYRGGEGDDRDGFRSRNLDGSVTLFETAKKAGVSTVIFLSSRAVYGKQLPGAVLTEETEPHPDTLYGAVKLAAERHLMAMGSETFRPVVLRVTGVYGALAKGGTQKWSSLIVDYREGRAVPSRVATEVHGEDVAKAVRLLLSELASGIFNVSDIVLDHRDILEMVQDAAGVPYALPAPADAAALNVMDTARLRALGWRPGGRALFEATVRDMVRG